MPYTGIVKYHVKLSFDVDGLVERADIIGAIFGQTEGLLGPEMNLNELQRVSKVGRIEVTTTSTENTTNGNVLLPMSTDVDTCALISAAIESIDKVGPFDCSFKLDAIDDVRASKKEDIVRRAKEIKQKWSTKSVSEGDTMLKDVHESIAGKVTTYGPNKLPCSTGVFDSPWIILVEGRADILNLLRAGFDNALAINGATIDESIKEMCKSKKKIVAFLDGDRAGGSTILLFAPSDPNTTVQIDINKLFFKHDRTVTTTYANSPNDLKEALSLIAEKKIPVADMITHRIALDEIQYGFDLVQNGLESLKVIVEPNRNGTN